MPCRGSSVVPSPPSVDGAQVEEALSADLRWQVVADISMKDSDGSCSEPPCWCKSNVSMYLWTYKNGML